eukprot:6671587-Ditylum_brightwellii.AAC.1
MEDKLNAHQVENNKNNEFFKEIFSKIFAALASIQELTTAHSNQIESLQDFTQKKNGKRQKHGADDNNLDSTMYKPDALSHNRDALASKRDGQGGVQCLPVPCVQCGLLYDIIEEKKKQRRARACIGTRTKHTHTIKKFLVHTDSPTHVPENKTEKEYDNNTGTDTTKTLLPEGTPDKANKFFTWTQNGFPVEFLTNNVNGLSTENGEGGLLEELTVLKDIKVCGKNKTATSNSQERTKTEYQPGGTATVVMDKWVSQVCNSGHDPLGRWSYATIKGRKDRK